MLLTRRSRRHVAQQLTDLDFADDLALITEAVSAEESLSQSLENAPAPVGLYCDGKTAHVNNSVDPP